MDQSDACTHVCPPDPLRERLDILEAQVRSLQMAAPRGIPEASAPMPCAAEEVYTLAQQADDEYTQLVPPPVCNRCNDTHRVETEERGTLMCTGCPTPCEGCRSRGPGRAGGPYCAATPCPCGCHVNHHQYDAVRQRLGEKAAPSSGPAEPEPGDECWGYSGSRDAEWWTGSLATREEAIAEALAELEEDVVWIYKGWKPAAAHFFPDADDLCETAAERASDEVGDPAEEYPEVSDEAKTELNALLEAWAEKHIATPRFWIGDGGEPERIERAGQFTSAGEKP
jgi:hypothetical protein